MNASFDTVIFYPMSYSDVSVYLESNSILIATGYFLDKSFSIQADYTSLNAYKYLLCDVSTSTIIPTDTNIPTKDINLAPVSSFNYIPELYEKQINQFYIINRPINYNMITSISYNIDLNSLNYSLTLYSSTTVYLYSLTTVYSYSSLTVYESFTVYSSTTVYSITSNTIYSYSSFTLYISSTLYSSTTVYSYSSNTIYNYSSLTVYDSFTLYSSTTIYSITSNTLYSYSSLTVYKSFTLYSSTTVYSITSNTVYSYSSLTVYDSTTLYSSTTVYSITSNTIYSYSSVTVYDSTTLYSSTTVYSITSNTIYSYSSVTYYSSTTIYSITSNTIYNSTTIYSSTVVYNNASITPIVLSYSGNITSWSTTYSLTYNQLMIISFTNSQTIFIPIQLTGNDNYRLILSQNISAYNSGGTSNWIVLYPNNSSVTAIFTYFVVNYNGGSVQTGSGDATSSGFFLSAGLGSIEATIINNTPFTKTIIIRDAELGLNADPATHIVAQIWNDYTTSWTMLGTITLPQASSGYVKILRTA